MTLKSIKKEVRDKAVIDEANKLWDYIQQQNAAGRTYDFKVFVHRFDKTANQILDRVIGIVAVDSVTKEEAEKKLQSLREEK